MNTVNRSLLVLLASLSLAYVPEALAEQTQQPAVPRYKQVEPERSYGEKVGEKALIGVTNLATAWLETPKSMINNFNSEQGNIFYALIGGLFEGMVQTGGRMTAGVADILTIPVPTKPFVSPQYIWDDFDSTTTYGDAFRLDNNAQLVQPYQATTRR